MIQPLRAPVKPRFVSPDTGDALVLDDTILELAERSSRGAIELVGMRGAGKTTALAHLAAVLSGNDEVVLLDEPDVVEVRVEARRHLVIFTTRQHREIADESFPLAAWNDDDVIEYLLAAHPQRCSAVMQVIRTDDIHDKLDGTPELWRVILDEMAAADPPISLRQAIQRGADRRLADEESTRLAGLYCLAFLIGDSEFAERLFGKLAAHGLGLVRLLGHRAVRLVLAARRVVSVLNTEAEHSFPTARLPEDLVKEIGYLAKSDEATVRSLASLLDVKQQMFQPMAASILHAAGAPWRPSRRACLLAGYFDDARWPGIDLQGGNLREVRLNRADLTGANLEQADLHKCQLRRAVLRDAKLSSTNLSRAFLAGADLSDVVASKAQFATADLSNAVLERAVLNKAEFSFADLTGASFRDANLRCADLRRAQIEDTDFRGADLTHAKLSGLPLHKAQLAGACFEGARVSSCDLEFVELPHARFYFANLRGALLTGSIMPGGDFKKAALSNAGLADIEWEGADLRGADLRGSSFHMGSSRSGLVGSPYPGHGSRTGFYTNDYDDQTYKAPEQIRKANLCGADLRGAKIGDVDFYLVDLRGAKYDADQAEHFRRCDAILEDRV
jgi:uncharacterized protein YjbI with pentapeptide repeats